MRKQKSGDGDREDRPKTGRKSEMRVYINNFSVIIFHARINTGLARWGIKIMKFFFL